MAREVQRLLLSGQKVEAALTAVRGGQHGIGALIASQLPPKARADVLAYVAQQAACPGTPLQGYLLVLAGRTALESHSAPVDVDKMLEAKVRGREAVISLLCMLFTIALLLLTPILFVDLRFL